MEKFASERNDLAETAAAQAVALEVKTHEEELAATEKAMEQLAAEKDYTGAAAAQAAVADLQERLSALSGLLRLWTNWKAM